MKTARRIAFNFLSLSISEIISKVLQLAIFVYVARIFGKTVFGDFGFSIAFGSIFSVLVDFGMGLLLIREISRRKNLVGSYVYSAVKAELLLSVLTFVLAFLYLNIMGYGKSLKLTAYIMLLFFVLQSFTNIFYFVFRAFEKMHYDASVKVLRMLMLSVLVFLASSHGFIYTILMFPITEFFMLAVSAAIYLKNFGKSPREKISLWKDSVPFFVSMIFVTSLIYADSLIIEHMHGSQQVGIYAAAYNILIGLTFIPLMYSNAIYPVFSKYFVNDKSLLKFAFRKSISYMLILGLPISIGIYFLGERIIQLIYGAEFSESAIALKILCWFIFLRFINIVPGTLLTSINKQGSRTLSQGLVLGINLVLNLILVPKYGYVGAAFATVISECFFIILYSYFIRINGYRFSLFSALLKPLIASGAMAFIIVNVSNIFLSVIFGIVSYFGILVLLRAFGKEDKTLFSRIMKDA